MIFKKIKLWQIVITVLLLSVLGFAFSLYDALYGNPLSAWIAEGRIREYASVTYKDLDLEYSKVAYNFKNHAYGCRVQSLKSTDTNFTVSYRKGKVTDDYEYEVAYHFTTYRRLSKDFGDLVKDIVSKEYPHKTTMVLGMLDGDTKLLTPDAPLDIKKMPSDLSLAVYVLSDVRSDEKMSELLLELHKLMLKKGITISKYSLRLEEPLPEEKKPGSGNNLYLTDLPASKITDDVKLLASSIKEYRMAYDREEKK